MRTEKKQSDDCILYGCRSIDVMFTIFLPDSPVPRRANWIFSSVMTEKIKKRFHEMSGIRFYGNGL